MKKEDIIEVLHDIEENEDVEIIYACESGSRVWGFENDESGHDVKFIYKKPGVDDYLSIRPSPDSIEYECDDLDIIGWDIKKALRMHYDDDPILRECLISNEIYINRDIKNIFSGLGGFDIDFLKNHYSEIALNDWKRYCSLQFSKTKSKKYLYVIRSILCWRLLNRDIYPPVNIEELLNHEYINLNGDITSAVYDLIDYHQDNGEITENIIFKLNNFIFDSFSVMKKVRCKSFKEFEEYDKRFRELLLVGK